MQSRQRNRCANVVCAAVSGAEADANPDIASNIGAHENRQTVFAAVCNLTCSCVMLADLENS